MKKMILHSTAMVVLCAIAVSSLAQTIQPPLVVASRLKEVFKQTDLKKNLADPWEITYAPDGFLWITEAKGYKVLRMNPANGDTTVVLNLQFDAVNTPALSGLSTTEWNNYKRKFLGNESGFKWPQGGMMGMAFHPEFNTNAAKRFVYLAYVQSWVGKHTNTSAPIDFPDGQGIYFTTLLTRWTYDPTLKKLKAPVTILGNIPGSSDHNSGRMIIAPVGATNYLFYAVGDMGAGQFENNSRTIRAQESTSIQGKILRFNLEDAPWIPTDNPFGSASPVYSTGIRNNQGFAYAKFAGNDRLFGSSHGPFSDDEINLIESGKNYGHPLVIGYADGNYNGVKAGAISGSLPLIPAINGEQTNATNIGANYRNPIYSFYSATSTRVTDIYNNQTANNLWPSEAPSGIDIYTHGAIPGWKNSLIMASLKWGRILRLKLNSTGTGVVPIDGSTDSVTYLESVNRYRDVAISPDGKTIYTVMDLGGASSGPSEPAPIVPTCAGCVQAYTFMGYQSTSNGKSAIPANTPIAPGTSNSCETLNSVTINSDNNNIWVPITDANGNIVAEIKANGENLGLVTASMYKNSNSVREDASKRLYLDRNIAITPTVQPGVGKLVNVRLYFSAAEFSALQNATNSNGQASGVSTTATLGVFKTPGGCTNTISGVASLVNADYTETFGLGYVMEVEIDKFSQFFFGNNNFAVLPISISLFNATWMGSNAVIKWNTATEENTSYFVVERSMDGRQFDSVYRVAAKGNSSPTQSYQLIDAASASLSANTLYYRLKILNANGATQYSSTAKLAKANSGFYVKAFPNPVKQQATLSIFAQQQEAFQWKLTDMSGRVMQAQSAIVNQGLNTFSIDMNRLPAGIYQLFVNAQSFSEQLKLQKQ